MVFLSGISEFQLLLPCILLLCTLSPPALLNHHIHVTHWRAPSCSCTGLLRSRRHLCLLRSPSQLNVLEDSGFHSALRGSSLSKPLQMASHLFRFYCIDVSIALSLLLMWCICHCFWLYSDSEHSVHTSMMEAVALFQVSPEWHPALTAIQQHWEHINIVYASLGGYCQVFVLKDSSFQCFGCIRYSLFHLYVWSAILYNHRTKIGKLADPLYSNVVLKGIGNLSSYQLYPSLDDRAHHENTWPFNVTFHPSRASSGIQNSEYEKRWHHLY